MSYRPGTRVDVKMTALKFNKPEVIQRYLVQIPAFCATKNNNTGNKKQSFARNKVHKSHHNPHIQ